MNHGPPGSVRGVLSNEHPYRDGVGSAERSLGRYSAARQGERLSARMLREKACLSVAAPSDKMSGMKVEDITEEALALTERGKSLLADRLVESLDPAEDGSTLLLRGSSELVQHAAVCYASTLKRAS